MGTEGELVLSRRAGATAAWERSAADDWRELLLESRSIWKALKAFKGGE